MGYRMVQTETRRLFFALCPGEQVRQQLWKLSDDMQFGRRTSFENLHITLIFLGAVNKDQRVCLEQAAANIPFSPFTLQIDRLGHWVRPKILWAGCLEVPKLLLSLVGKLQENIDDCGFQQTQKQDYIPHATLARKVGAGQGDQFCEQHHPIEPIKWHVKNFSLMESVTYAEGPVYKVLRTW